MGSKRLEDILIGYEASVDVYSNMVLVGLNRILATCCLLAQSVISQDDGSVIGVSKDRQHLYKPIDGKWRCLGDSSVIIDASKVNNGICDCPDGSDEPGTGACGEKSLFSCQNEGFIPRYISGCKVSDGACDCCDCSDEYFVDGKPFYRGSDCKALQETYDKLVEREIDTWKRGYETLEELKKYYKIESIENKMANSKETLVRLKADIERISKDAKTYESMLNDENKRYDNELISNNPFLYEFQKMNMTFLSANANSSFSEIETFSRAYQELVSILHDLTDSYTHSLKDRVVNQNIKKFATYEKKNMIKIKADPEIDVGQQVQLAEYFLEELPNLFLKRKSEFPAKYNVGKVNFVRAMITGKANYTETILELIRFMRDIMDDISANYNVNFQDAGVKAAVQSYQNYLNKYNSLDKKVELPHEFEEELYKLFTFVTENVPKILNDNVNGGAIDDEDEFSWGGIMNKIAGYLPNGENSFAASISVLKNQIATHSSELSKLNNEMATKTNELETLESLIKEFHNQTEDGKILSSYKDIMERMRSKGLDSETYCIQETIDNYIYDICINPALPGSIHQRELTGDKNVINIGSLRNVKFDKTTNINKFVEYMKMQYSEYDIMLHLINDTEIVGEETYLFGNLPEVNNGIVLQYADGEKCWNGPNRSAQVFIRCAESFKIHNVQETTKCNYVFEVSGPLGCSNRFEYRSTSAQN